MNSYNRMNCYIITKRENNYLATRGNLNTFIKFGSLVAFIKEQQGKGFVCKMATIAKGVTK